VADPARPAIRLTHKKPGALRAAFFAAFISDGTTLSMHHHLSVLHHSFARRAPACIEAAHGRCAESSRETNLDFRTLLTSSGARIAGTVPLCVIFALRDSENMRAWEARKRIRDALPKRINETLSQGKALLKQAKKATR